MEPPREGGYHVVTGRRGLRGGAPSTPALMCRNIRTLANFEPPASDAEVRDAALQFVRKLSGATRPSRANAEAFDRAVDEIAAAAQRLLQSLHTSAPPRDRDRERARARERSARRFGTRSPADAQGDVQGDAAPS